MYVCVIVCVYIHIQICLAVERLYGALQWQIWDIGKDRRVRNGSCTECVCELYSLQVYNGLQ